MISFFKKGYRKADITIIKKMERSGRPSKRLSKKTKTVSYDNLGAVLAGMGYTHRIHQMMCRDEKGNIFGCQKKPIRYDQMRWHKNKVCMLVGIDKPDKNCPDRIMTNLVINRR